MQPGTAGPAHPMRRTRFDTCSVEVTQSKTWSTRSHRIRTPPLPSASAQSTLPSLGAVPGNVETLTGDGRGEGPLVRVGPLLSN
jgi:hypothetical protein